MNIAILCLLAAATSMPPAFPKDLHLMPARKFELRIDATHSARIELSERPAVDGDLINLAPCAACASHGRARIESALARTECTEARLSDARTPLEFPIVLLTSAERRSPRSMEARTLSTFSVRSPGAVGVGQEAHSTSLHSCPPGQAVEQHLEDGSRHPYRRVSRRDRETWSARRQRGPGNTCAAERAALPRGDSILTSICILFRCHRHKEMLMIAPRKLNSGIVRLVQSTLDGVGAERTMVELPKESLAQIAGELGRVGKLLSEERELAAIERLEARLESIFPKSQLEVPERNSNAGTGPLPEVPVSLARAAKILGRSKARTLRPAIDAGLVRTILQGKRMLIPPDELRRLAAEGVGPPPASPRRARRMTKPSSQRNLDEQLSRVAALRRREE